MIEGAGVRKMGDDRLVNAMKIDRLHGVKLAVMYFYRCARAKAKETTSCRRASDYLGVALLFSGAQNSKL